MKQEHLSHPERASDHELDAALTERAELFYSREMAEIVETPEFLLNPAFCEELLAALDIKQKAWQRTIQKRRATGTNEATFARLTLDRVGSKARQDMARKVRGSSYDATERAAMFAEAEGKARNRQMSFLGEIRWYEDHQEALDTFVERLADHLDHLTGLSDETSPFDEAHHPSRVPLSDAA
jgi:hypothetical protein